MTGIVTIVCLVLAAAVVVTAGLRALRNESVTRLELAAAALLELGMVAYVVARVVDLVHGPKPASVTLAVLYLVGALLVMPVATALGIAERSKWGPVVVAVGAIVVAVLFARIDQVWRPHG